jgi:hypothetical protein
VQDVGTDAAQYDLLKWTAKTGVLQGAEIPGLRKPLGETDSALNILATSVLGAIIQKQVLTALDPQAALPDLLKKLQQHPSFDSWKTAFTVAADLQKLGTNLENPGAKYESRALEGVWAAAPYLHNGSVPTLAELLKPSWQRVASFKVGPAYDTANVGLAAEQTKFNYTLNTTDCSDLHSGNSRCGHEYGTSLKPEEKKALLEYLKTL